MQTPEEYEVTLRVNALVKGLKQRRGYTKKDISQHLGIGLTTFNDYLNGVSSFKLGTLIRFAKLCKLSVADILDDTLEAQKLYADMVKDKANQSKNALDFLGFMLFLPAMVSAQGLQEVTCILMVMLLIVGGRDWNSHSLSLVFLTVFTLTYLVFMPITSLLFPIFTGFGQNVIAFGGSLVFDFILILLLKYRIAIGLWLSKGKCPTLLEKNSIEGPLLASLLGYAIFDGMAFIENLIRNLERLGVDEDFAKQFWHITYIYDYYEYYKFGLMLLSVLFLFIGIRIRQHTVMV